MIITLAIILGQLIRLPFFSGGITALDITIIIFSLVGLVKIKFKLKKPSSVIFTTLLFILIATISLIFTPLKLEFKEYLVSFSYTIRLFLYALFIWLLYSNAFPSFNKNIITTLKYSGVGLSILGLLQFILLPDLSFLSKYGWDPHYFRTVSTFLDPNFAGAYFALTFYLLFNEVKNKWKTILIIIVYLSLLTTFSRSSYLMFLISGLSLSFFNRSKKMLFSIILLFSILLLGFNIYTRLISKPRNIDRIKSASYRLNTWQQGIDIFRAYPILGVGFNTYRYAIKTNSLGDEQFINSHGSSSNDSSLLFVLSTTGIIGAIFYCVFLITLFKQGLKREFILSSSILGLLVHSIFANSLFFSPILLWLILISLTPKK